MTIGTLVGMRTGPFTFRFFSLAPRIRSAQTKVKDKDKNLVRNVLKNGANTTYQEVVAQNSVYVSSGCITQKIYPHCSGVSQVAVTICQPLFTLLQRFDVAAGEGDADAVDGDLGLNRCLASVLESLHE